MFDIIQRPPRTPEKRSVQSEVSVMNNVKINLQQEFDKERDLEAGIIEHEDEYEDDFHYDQIQCRHIIPVMWIMCVMLFIGVCTHTDSIFIMPPTYHID